MDIPYSIEWRLNEIDRVIERLGDTGDAERNSSLTRESHPLAYDVGWHRQARESAAKAISGHMAAIRAALDEEDEAAA